MPLLFPSSNIAKVTVNGEQVLEINLETSEDEVFDLNHKGVNVVVEVKDHKIHFLSSDCPDSVCVKSGFIKNHRDTSVCIPNKTAIFIYKAEN